MPAFRATSGSPQNGSRSIWSVPWWPPGTTTFSRPQGLRLGRYPEAIEKTVERPAHGGGGSDDGFSNNSRKLLFLSPPAQPLHRRRRRSSHYDDRRLERRILEVYLNVVEWGNEIFGAEARRATLLRESSAASLGPVQAARMAVMLRNPRRYEKQFGPAAGRARRQRAAPHDLPEVP